MAYEKLVDVTYNQGTVTELTTCLNIFHRFACWSATYDHLTHLCYLSEQDRFMQPDSLVPRQGSDYLKNQVKITYKYFRSNSLNIFCLPVQILTVVSRLLSADLRPVPHLHRKVRGGIHGHPVQAALQQRQGVQLQVILLSARGENNKVHCLIVSRLISFRTLCREGVKKAGQTLHQHLQLQPVRPDQLMDHLTNIRPQYVSNTKCEDFCLSESR